MPKGVEPAEGLCYSFLPAPPRTLDSEKEFAGRIEGMKKFLFIFAVFAVASTVSATSPDGDVPVFSGPIYSPSLTELRLPNGISAEIDDSGYLHIKNETDHDFYLTREGVDIYKITREGMFQRINKLRVRSPLARNGEAEFSVQGIGYGLLIPRPSGSYIFTSSLAGLYDYDIANGEAHQIWSKENIDAVMGERATNGDSCVYSVLPLEAKFFMAFDNCGKSNKVLSVEDRVSGGLKGRIVIGGPEYVGGFLLSAREGNSLILGAAGEYWRVDNPHQSVADWEQINDVQFTEVVNRASTKTKSDIPSQLDADLDLQENLFVLFGYHSENRDIRDQYHGGVLMIRRDGTREEITALHEVMEEREPLKIAVDDSGENAYVLTRLTEFKGRYDYLLGYEIYRLNLTSGKVERLEIPNLYGVKDIAAVDNELHVSELGVFSDKGSNKIKLEFKKPNVFEGRLADEGAFLRIDYHITGWQGEFPPEFRLFGTPASTAAPVILVLIGVPVAFSVFTVRRKMRIAAALGVLVSILLIVVVGAELKSVFEDLNIPLSELPRLFFIGFD